MIDLDVPKHRPLPLLRALQGLPVEPDLSPREIQERYQNMVEFLCLYGQSGASQIAAGKACLQRHAVCGSVVNFTPSGVRHCECGTLGVTCMYADLDAVIPKWGLINSRSFYEEREIPEDPTLFLPLLAALEEVQRISDL